VNRALWAAAAVIAVAAAPAVQARTAAQITAQGKQTLRLLESQQPDAHRLAAKARAILVFPSILKAGFVFGAQSGNGVLLVNGKTRGYYNLSGGSWGLQIGAQDFSYVMFLMNDKALANVENNIGLAAGTGPSVVIINKGAAAAVDTSMIEHDVYAFPFNGKGLMADLTLQGTKISHIHPK
jgi:lipid-binding SYLF domain-containing protein